MMANNRMYLKCSCGKTIMLAKYYPGPGWYVQGGEGDIDILTKYEDLLNEWLDEHTHCDKTDGSMWGPTHFKLEYEQEGGD